MFKVECAMESGHGPGKSQDRIALPDKILAEGRYQAQGPAGAVYAIMDGVGGIPGGEVASSFCACEMMNCPVESILADEGAQAAERMEDLLIEMDAALKHAGAMATTLSGLLMVNEKSGLLFHVGNTRIWGLIGRYLRQLTTDHTQVADMEMQGMEITDTLRANVGHIITASLGGREKTLEKKVTVEWVSLDRYDALLFTCDGIHEYVSIEDLENIVYGEKPLEEAIAIARQNGSTDDCSLMVIRREEVLPETPETAETIETASEGEAGEGKPNMPPEEVRVPEPNRPRSSAPGKRSGERFPWFGRR